MLDMMKIRPFAITLICLLLTASIAHAQGKLYYFINLQDSLIGVKDDKGQVIIPAKYEWLSSEPGDLITDSIIIFAAWNKTADYVATSFGDAYDRRGRLLYHPLFFDNGPDYTFEGLIRCVENGKIGFVNEQGQVIIKPQWDWVTEFNYGYAWACNGCYFDKEELEHPPIKFRKDAEKTYINKKGNPVKTSARPFHSKDLRIDSVTYLPYPFEYTADEQKLVDSLNNLEVISRIYLTNVFGTDAPLQFEILENPNNNNPYYKIQGYSSTNRTYYNEGFFQFQVDKAGTLFYYDRFDRKRIPYREWLKKELLNSVEFFRENPDAQHKFDVEKYLSELK
jgi:hypothetical protein